MTAPDVSVCIITHFSVETGYQEISFLNMKIIGINNKQTINSCYIKNIGTGWKLISGNFMHVPTIFSPSSTNCILFSSTDIDECKMFGYCSQKCKNVKGSYHCHCAANYQMTNATMPTGSNGFLCKVKGTVRCLLHPKPDICKSVSKSNFGWAVCPCNRLIVNKMPLKEQIVGPIIGSI